MKLLQAKDPLPFPSEPKYENSDVLSFSGQWAITIIIIIIVKILAEC